MLVAHGNKLVFVRADLWRRPQHHAVDDGALPGEADRQRHHAGQQRQGDAPQAGALPSVAACFHLRPGQLRLSLQNTLLK